MDRTRMERNRLHWDESVPHHLVAPSYDVPGFLRGANTLDPLERKALPNVRGRRLLHLQCHFGLDTLSWARLGARVTGIDFSPPALEAARGLAREAGLAATFVESNLYDLPKRLDGKFDIVYTAKGAICWLPDLDRWAEVVSHFLVPGGRFYMLEDHPVADVYTNDRGTRDFHFEASYFGGAPMREEYDETYATKNAHLKNTVTFGWIHPLSEVVNALVDHGLTIERLEEYPFAYWHKFPFMRKGQDGYWHLTKQEGRVPLAYSVLARKRR